MRLTQDRLSRPGQANDIEMETWAAEIKLRASRRIGQISRALEKGKGKGKGQVIPSSGKFKEKTLKDAGISNSSAHRCEAIAAIPEQDHQGHFSRVK